MPLSTEDHLELLMEWFERTSDKRLSTFKEVEPFHPQFLDLQGDQEEERVPWDAKPTDIGKPLNISIMGSVVAKDGDFNYSLIKVRQVDAAEVRGQVRLTPPRIVTVKTAIVHPTKPPMSALTHLGHIGGAWQVIGPAAVWDRGILASTRNEIIQDGLTFTKLAYGLAWTRQFFWRVVLQKEDTPSLSFNTDASGVREVFRLRDIPEGRTRRAALRNWVSAHWRQKRREPNDEVHIRKHLRGAQTFNWMGMACHIIPSPDEVQTAIRNGAKGPAT